MAYREENDQVILTMSREDYQRLLLLVGAACEWGNSRKSILTLRQNVEFLNRINSGNPHYTPYQVKP